MSWKFWENGKDSGKLPDRMSKQLGWRFGVSVEAMDELRYASKSGPMGTLLVRVFDPKSLAGDAPVIKRYDDLDDQQSAVQFECRWYPKSSKLDDVVDCRLSASS